tara:strand:+ start:197 stop:301 length:105 start_codon:yes stop_codon:yes gene_type:complete
MMGQMSSPFFELFFKSSGDPDGTSHYAAAGDPVS